MYSTPPPSHHPTHKPARHTEWPQETKASTDAERPTLQMLQQDTERKLTNPLSLDQILLSAYQKCLLFLQLLHPVE